MTGTNLSDAASVLMPSESLEWFVVAQLEETLIAFPSILIAETFLIERSQILSLPFYPPTVLGCVHHEGTIVPLITPHQFLGIPAGPQRERLTVIRLSSLAYHHSSIGLAVHQVLGRQTREQLPPELFNSHQESSGKMRLFQPEVLDTSLWQPWRWQPEAV